MQAGFPLKYAMLAWLCLLWPRLAGSKCREPSGNLWQWVESHAASTGARCAVPASLDVLWRHACTHSAFQYEFRTPDWFWYWIRLNNLNLSLFVCHLSPFAGSAVCWPASLEVCWHSKSKWHVTCVQSISYDRFDRSSYCDNRIVRSLSSHVFFNHMTWLIILGQSESAKSNGYMMSHVYSIYPASSASASARFPRLEKHRGSTDFPLIWDLTHNIQFSNWKEAEHQEFLPCLLRGHRYWHVGRGSSLAVALWVCDGGRCLDLDSEIIWYDSMIW